MKYKAFGAIDLLVTLIITAVILLIGINSLKGISSLKLNDSPVDSESVQEHVDKTVNEIEKMRQESIKYNQENLENY